MHRDTRNRMEKRLGELRRNMNALGKFGMSDAYYVHHLHEVTKIASKATEEIAIDMLQMRIGETE